MTSQPGMQYKLEEHNRLALLPEISAEAVWDQVSGLTPKGIKRMIISIVDADGERIIISHTAAQHDLSTLYQLAL